MEAREWLKMGGNTQGKCRVWCREIMCRNYQKKETCKTLQNCPSMRQLEDLHWLLRSVIIPNFSIYRNLTYQGIKKETPCCKISQQPWPQSRGTAGGCAPIAVLVVMPFSPPPHIPGVISSHRIDHMLGGWFRPQTETSPPSLVSVA